MELGSKIFSLRKDAKISQEQLAEKLNVTRQTISNWELGQTTPDIIQANQIAKTFHISLDELMGNDIKEVLTNKIIDTEKSINSIIRTLKFLFITIICGLGIFIVMNITTLLMFHDNTKQITAPLKELTTQEFNCTLNGQTYQYVISYDENYHVNNYLYNLSHGDVNLLDSELWKLLNEYDDAREMISKIQSYYEDKGGTCEKTREYHYVL